MEVLPVTGHLLSSCIKLPPLVIPSTITAQKTIKLHQGKNPCGGSSCSIFDDFFSWFYTLKKRHLVILIECIN
jgi:hypothetical protein